MKARCAIRMLEEATYFGHVYWRWVDERGWEAVSAVSDRRSLEQSPCSEIEWD